MRVTNGDALARALVSSHAGKSPKALDARVRRASTLTLVFEGQGLLLYNFRTGACVDWSPLRAALLAPLSQWMPLRRLVARVRPQSQAVAEIARLIRAGVVVVEGTDEAATDRLYETDWDWDIRAGLFHLAIKNPAFLTEQETTVDLEEKAVVKAPIPLFTTNDHLPEVVDLPAPRANGRGRLFGLLERRRSRRAFTDAAISRQALADMLFAGLGITGYLVNVVKGMGRLPLKMTPSGGARNPFEAYVYASRVRGLQCGIYHYSAAQHSLGRVDTDALPPPSAFVADQAWADDAAAVIVLVAHFRRTMWKYEHPMAYRAVLIEAGHVAQNMMLAATAHRLSTVPTAALNDALFERVLGLNGITETATYVIAAGAPAHGRPDWGRWEPNTRLARTPRKAGGRATRR